jgi:hypothetical protein
VARQPLGAEDPHAVGLGAAPEGDTDIGPVDAKGGYHLDRSIEHRLHGCRLGAGLVEDPVLVGPVVV